MHNARLKKIKAQPNLGCTPLPTCRHRLRGRWEADPCTEAQVLRVRVGAEVVAPVVRFLGSC